jgi:hypothetical protein
VKQQCGPKVEARPAESGDEFKVTDGDIRVKTGKPRGHEHGEIRLRLVSLHIRRRGRATRERSRRAPTARGKSREGELGGMVEEHHGDADCNVRKEPVTSVRGLRRRVRGERWCGVVCSGAMVLTETTADDCGGQRRTEKRKGGT